MTEFFSSAGLQQALELARDIIVIGAASCEFEDPTDPDEEMEERRAENRAGVMLSWLRQVLPNTDLTLYSINLGRYRLRPQDCPYDDPWATRKQRGAYLVSVHHRSPEVENRQDLEQLVEDHLSQDDNCLGIELSRYSRGDRLRMELARGPAPVAR